MDTIEQLEILSEEMALELENILEFWSMRTVDQKYGGFVGCIDQEGDVVSEASKSAVLNTRLLWTFAAGYRLIGSEKLEQMATRAYRYLVDKFWDKEFGGLFWELDFKGEVLNSRKQAYAQGFGVYAFTELYLATGNKESLEYAKKLYNLIETHFSESTFGGYIEALDREWKPLADMRLSEKDANLPKSMNTHLHILEPYTNLYRAWPDQGLRERILHLLDIFQTKIVNHKTGHFGLFFDLDWTPKSDIVSFGHDIEGAWLLHEAAIETAATDRIADVQQTALKLVNSTLEEGTDRDGSLFYEKEGEQLDTDKHWWPQAEALVGLMDVWEITEENRYITEIVRIWDFIKENVIDYENGEWFGRIDKNGNAISTEDKVGFWKCPYHNTRSMIEMINRINKELIK
ncbi:AGE family epimerase/isomerase [Draconibacterium sp. IB214405]|uniref:AGE family epimerase/isomerase n=1 Tax=Draconibacterium sp. IB214405 TaxID=3097352 RepID=UPI002A1808F3|nr:AGE family epimerase/isomerase [Draconibacterium sp. IB214405]MDX8340713.1 AGE family epimerase/isomerase [Draconibacterium sp. IB214405]